MVNVKRTQFKGGRRMSKSVVAVITALALITIAAFGGYTYVQGVVYNEYNVRNYEVETSVDGDETTLVFTLDKNEAYANTRYDKQTTLPDEFGNELYGSVTIRPEPTKNNDGTYALDEDGNYQYGDWTKLGSAGDDESEMSFSEALQLVREGKTTDTVFYEYSYEDAGDKAILTVVIKGYEFKDGDNIHIEIDNDITVAGFKIHNNSLALTNVEFKDGKFTEVKNMFVNSQLDAE